MDDLKLTFGYTFWLQEVERGKNTQYGSNLKEVITVQTIKQFWEIYQFLKKTSDLPKDCDLYLFRQGIKPQWQDKGNAGGGCFKIKVDKKKSNKFWQNAVLSLVNPNNKYSDILNGVRIKIKQKFDEIEIWMGRQSANKEKLENVKVYLKQNLQVTQQRAYSYVAFK